MVKRNGSQRTGYLLSISKQKLQKTHLFVAVVAKLWFRRMRLVPILTYLLTQIWLRATKSRCWVQLWQRDRATLSIGWMLSNAAYYHKPVRKIASKNSPTNHSWTRRSHWVAGTLLSYRTGAVLPINDLSILHRFRDNTGTTNFALQATGVFQFDTQLNCRLACT